MSAPGTGRSVAGDKSRPVFAGPGKRLRNAIPS
jgi:hypothetical protein